ARDVEHIGIEVRVNVDLCRVARPFVFEVDGVRHPFADVYLRRPRDVVRIEWRRDRRGAARWGRDAPRARVCGPGRRPGGGGIGAGGVLLSFGGSHFWGGGSECGSNPHPSSAASAMAAPAAARISIAIASFLALNATAAAPSNAAMSAAASLHRSEGPLIGDT